MLVLVHNHRRANREVQWEPRLHSWCMFRGVDTVKHVLIELSREVASKSMDFRLVLLHSEGETTILTHRLIHALGKVLERLLVGIGQMTEGEHIL